MLKVSEKEYFAGNQHHQEPIILTGSGPVLLNHSHSPMNCTANAFWIEISFLGAKNFPQSVTSVESLLQANSGDRSDFPQFGKSLQFHYTISFASTGAPQLVNYFYPNNSQCKFVRQKARFYISSRLLFEDVEPNYSSVWLKESQFTNWYLRRPSSDLHAVWWWCL